MKTDVLIIGAGLSGLRIAHQLSKRNVNVKIIDSRDRIGGRIQSKNTSSSGSLAGIDMGPSWFWPWQQRMIALVQELQLEARVYEQYSEGVAVAEYRNGQLHKQAGIASMAGSLRLEGGLKTLVFELSKAIPPEHIHLNTLVEHITTTDSGIDVFCQQPEGNITYVAEHVVVAAPPRVVDESITFTPAWSTNDQALMKQTPTWMAGQAKFCAVYDTPFWREQGLSGDGVSEMGPLGEIHDASAASGAPYALFGFVGVPAPARAGKSEQIKQAAIEQLARMFGDEAATPSAVFYKDWAEDSLTSTNADRNGPRAHAHQTVSIEPHWEQKLYWAGSETASPSSGDNGYLEGALDAAERVIKQLTSKLAV